jgi:hypothetical protein
MKKYQQLESQIKELQAEVERLKQEEASNKLPNLFKIDDVKKLLDTGDINIIEYAFDWSDTSQGYGYWYSIFCTDEPLTDKVIIQLQKWVIIYLEQNQK